MSAILTEHAVFDCNANYGLFISYLFSLVVLHCTNVQMLFLYIQLLPIRN